MENVKSSELPLMGVIGYSFTSAVVERDWSVMAEVSASSFIVLLDAEETHTLLFKYKDMLIVTER